MMARRSKREAARRRKQTVIATVILVIVLLLGIGVVYWDLHQTPNLDKTTLCPADGPKGHYVLLVDKTDPLNFTQKEAFIAILRELVEKRVPEGYLLSVFVLGADFKANAKPLIELCNPGTGKDKSEWTANPKQLQRQYQERFLKPLMKQSEALLAKQPEKWSPIFEMLQMVGINGFRKDDVHGEHRLIIMSDMLHNTPEFSMYKGLVDFDTFSASSYGRKAQAELPDVKVEIDYLINTPRLQTRRNLKFWEDYFDKAGARIVAVQPLEG